MGARLHARGAFWLCVAGATLFFGSAARAQEADQADHVGPAERDVAAVLEAAFAATERRDYAALDTLYAADVTVLEGAGLDRGWVQYRDHHLKPELKEFKGFVYRPRDIEIHIAGDWAWALFAYDLQLEVEGRAIDREGRGTVIFEKDGDRWLIRHMQTASRPRR